MNMTVFFNNEELFFFQLNISLNIGHQKKISLNIKVSLTKLDTSQFIGLVTYYVSCESL